MPPPPKDLSIPVTMDMTSRFLGLVVVPGEHIVNIEVEEFESQIKGRANKFGMGKSVV